MSGKTIPFRCDLGIIWTIYILGAQIHLDSEITRKLISIEAHSSKSEEEQVSLIITEIQGCKSACGGKKESCPFKRLR